MKNLIIEKSEDVVDIELEMIADTREASNYFIADILTDIRGLRNVITTTQMSPGIHLNSGAEKYKLKIKFENDISVDLPTLIVQINSLPGVKRSKILSVDGRKYNQLQGKADYQTARSKKSIEHERERKTGIGAIKGVVSRFEESILRKYVRYLILESPNSPKVIFMAGAPGSGKSTVIRRLGLADRLKIINPDDQYEREMEEEGVPADRATLLDKYKPLKDEYLAAQESGDTQRVAELEPEYLELRGALSRNMQLFARARAQAKKDQQDAMENQGEFLVDGTGGNYKEISKQVKKLKEAGYEVAMIFIDVPVETSIARDHFRGETGRRRLGRKTVERSHASVTANKPLYEELFGEDFFYVENSEDNFESSIDSINSGIARFLQ